MLDTFADRIAARVERLGPLCVGLDPFAERIPVLFGDPRVGAAALERFFEAVLECATPVAACVKLQLGLFEPYGPEGVAVAQRLTHAAQSAGLPMILDAKRGDIGTTAQGYAAASLGPAPGFDADCVTLNPYMGIETLEPFVSIAEAAGKGVAVLVRTSNPGARDFQDIHADGQPLWAHVARALGPLEQRLMAGCGWSNLMVVAGATAPAEARALRAILPKALFLVPGFGAQGASAQEALAGLVDGQGGVVNASRAALYPPGAEAASSLAQWRSLAGDAMARLAAELRP